MGFQNQMQTIIFKALRVFRWLGLGFLVLLLVLAAAYYTQVAIESNYSGVRGPYLQRPAPDAISIHWQTAEKTLGSVRYGTSATSLSQVLHETEATEVHTVRLRDLKPLTRYYYQIEAGNETIPLYQGQFMTAAAYGQNVPVRLWVLGDPGSATSIQDKVKQAALDWITKHPRPGRALVDGLLTTGDNAYRSGSNQEFQDNFFTPYQDILKQIPVWPTYGNHDARRWAFYRIFSFPTRGESGGLASASKSYYAFDYGPVHVVMLDSHDSDKDPSGPMLQWLERDLATTRQPWLLALIHHPPYTKGGHNSDDPGDSRARMLKVRQNVLPLLEKYGVDLMISGHSHNYERSYLLNCHYGVSGSLKPSMILSKAQPSVFRKQALAREPHQGSIYMVVGSSARVDQGRLGHPAMQVSANIPGSLLVDIEGLTLTARFLDEQGQVQDHIQIRKGQADGIAYNQTCD